MVNGVNYTYIDAVLALVDKAKFYPSDDGTYENIKWVDDRDQPSANAVSSKLIELKSQEKLYFIRKERNKLLTETDWTAGDDVPESIKNLYRPYRQALRDITNQSDPNNIIWPTL
jgi:hypothetical protein